MPRDVGRAEHPPGSGIGRPDGAVIVHYKDSRRRRVDEHVEEMVLFHDPQALVLECFDHPVECGRYAVGVALTDVGQAAAEILFVEQ